MSARFQAAFVSEDAKIAAVHAAGLVALWGFLTLIFKAGFAKYPELHKKAAYFAYLTTAMVPIVVLSVAGFYAMDNLTRDSTSQMRLLEEAPGAITACRMQITYQIFSLTAAAIHGAPINTIEMIMHHIGAGLIGFLSLAPYVQTYAVFYGGFVELSNIPLTYIDICKHWPYLRKAYPTFHDVNRIVFAFVFVVLRNVMWPYYTCKLGYDLYMLKDSLPYSVIGGTMFCMISLTALQFIWGKLIIGMAVRSIKGLSGGGDKKKREEKAAAKKDS